MPKFVKRLTEEQLRAIISVYVYTHPKDKKFTTAEIVELVVRAFEKADVFVVREKEEAHEQPTYKVPTRNV